MADLIPFSYNEVYQGIAKKLLEKGYDIPYEGSNTAMLASILSYTAQSINFNAATNIKESLLTLATKRKNAIRDARILSYEPKGRISTQLKIYLKAKNQGTVRIEKFQKFTIDDYDYYYIDDTFTKFLEIDETFSIVVKQGTLVKHEDYSSVLEYTINENDYIDIPFSDVENDGLFVTVDTYTGTGDKRDNVNFTKREFNLIDVSDNYGDEYFRQDDVETGNCRIFFRLGGFGTKLRDGSKVRVSVLRSDGQAPNSEIYSSVEIDGNLSEELEPITTGEKAPQIYVYGQDEESVESIRNNAPLFYNTSGRCITKYDYKAFLGTKSSILEGQVWGGEDELTQTTGTVYFCCIPQFTPSFTVNGTEKYGADSTYNSFLSAQNLNYKSNQFVADGDFIGSNGVLSLCKKYGSPGLHYYIKNPVYFFVDLKIDIKKYEYGAVKADVNKKIFDEIKSYFDERLGYNKNFVETALISKISDILGKSNGFTFGSYLSFTLDDKNAVNIVSTEFDYNSNIISYSSEVFNNQVEVNLKLNSACAEGDSVNVEFDKPVEYLDSKVKSVTAQITGNDIIAFQKRVVADIATSIDVGVTWTSKSGTSKVTAKRAPQIYPNNYYTSTLRNGVFSINVLLTPNNEIGDKYDLFYKKNDILTKIELGGFNVSNILSRADINQGEINITIVDNQNTLAEVQNAEDVVVKFIEKKKVLTLDGRVIDENTATPEELKNAETEIIETYRNSVLCDTMDECKSRLNEDTENLYKNLDTNTFFINTTKNPDDSYKVTMYLTKYMNTGDIVEIEFAGKNTYILTESDIQNGIANYTLTVENPKVVGVYYNSASGVVMQVIEETQFGDESLIKESDDRIQFTNATGVDNVIPYKYVPTPDKKIVFKTDYICKFYKGQNNKLDIRNLILNYGDIGSLNPDSKNPEVTITSVEFSGFEAEYEFPYITLTNPQTTGILNVFAEMTVLGANGGFYGTSIQIPVSEPSQDTTQLTEGIGGVYIHLDLPVEGVYDEEGNIITDNLPRVFGISVSNGEDFINPETLYETDKTIDLSKDYVDSLLWADLSINEKNRNSIYPYSAEGDVKANSYSWLRFPIYFRSIDKAKEQVGTYMIINGTNPYIRIKLRNSVLSYFNDKDFGVVYPSNNFTFVKNSVLRLRSVEFIENIEDDPRDAIRESQLDETLFDGLGNLS